MSEKDLVKELKAEIVEMTKDRDDAFDKVKAKESRMKQVLIKLEHSTQKANTSRSSVFGKLSVPVRIHSRSARRCGPSRHSFARQYCFQEQTHGS